MLRRTSNLLLYQEDEDEESADLSLTRFAALFRDAGREYDTRALARNKILKTVKGSQSES